MDDFIAKEYPRDRYREAIASAKQELLGKTPTLYSSWGEEILTTYAERFVRSRLAKQLPLMSIEDFSRSRE